MKKKILSGILVLAMMLTMLPTAFADEVYSLVTLPATTEQLYPGEGAETVADLISGTNLTLTGADSAYTLTGVATYVTNMNTFSGGTTDYKSGHYVALQLNRPTDLDNTKEYSITTSGMSTKDKTYSTATTTEDAANGQYGIRGIWKTSSYEIFVIRLENVTSTSVTFTVSYKTSDDTNKSVTATVDLSGVKRVPQTMTVAMTNNMGAFQVDGAVAPTDGTVKYAIVDNLTAFNKLYTTTSIGTATNDLGLANTVSITQAHNGKYLVAVKGTTNVEATGYCLIKDQVAAREYALTWTAATGADTVNVYLDASGASVVNSGNSVANGAYVYVAPVANDGYEITGVTYTADGVTKSAGLLNGKYIFAMPAAATTIAVTTTLKPAFEISVLEPSDTISDKNKNVSDIQDNITVEKTGAYSYKVSGESKAITDWTEFDSDGQYVSGYFLILGLTANQAILTSGTYDLTVKGLNEVKTTGIPYNATCTPLVNLKAMRDAGQNTFQLIMEYNSTATATITIDFSDVKFVTTASAAASGTGTVASPSTSTVDSTTTSSASSLASDASAGSTPTLSIDSTSSGGTDAATNVTLDNGALTALDSAADTAAGKGADLNVTVKTDAVDVTVNGTVLNTLSDAANGSSVTLQVTKQGENDVSTTDKDKMAREPVASSKVIEVKFVETTGNTEINVQSANAKIDLRVNFGLTKAELEGVEIWYLDSNGVNDKVTDYDVLEDGTVILHLNHLTTFYVATKDVVSGNGGIYPNGWITDGNKPGDAWWNGTTPGTSDDEKDDEDKKDDTTTEVEIDFVDVTENDWFYDEIKWAYNKGVMFGREGGTFAPNAEMTYLEVITAMARYAGETIEATDTDWADKALEWGIANGITDGSDKTALITRERLVTLLARLAAKMDVTLSANGDLTAFPDAADLSDWAADAMTWAVGEGIINGMDGAMNPAGNTTRAQVVTVLMRFDALVNNAE